MASTTKVMALLVVGLACLVAPSYGQAAASTINCYQCSGSPGLGTNQGCAYPFNSTGLPVVACPGQCTRTVYFNAASTYPSFYGAADTVVRGCTQTTPAVGCSSSSTSPGVTVCVGVCSTSLCNSAVSLVQSPIIRLVAASVGLLFVFVNFRRN